MSKHHPKQKDNVPPASAGAKGWKWKWFGRSNSSLDEGSLRRTGRDSLFSDKTFRCLSQETETATRLKTLKDLEEIVLSRYLDDGVVETIWCCIQDLFSFEHGESVRREAFAFMIRLVKGQYSYLGINRAVFFLFLKNHNISEDLQLKIDLLKQLTQDGKNVSEFEEDIAVLLVDWTNDVLRSASGLTGDYFNLVLNIVKYNASCFEEETIKTLIDTTCIYACHSSNSRDIEVCLNLLDTIQCYSYLPSGSLLAVITSLCKLVNCENVCESCWKLMRKLLNTHLGHSAVYTLCNILQRAELYPDISPIRGAVYFLGMSMWGSQRVTTLKHTPVSILPSLHDALKCRSPVVVSEVALSIQRLVVKYGIELQLVTWDMIVLILENLLQYIKTEGVNSSSHLFNTVHETLTTMERYHDSNSFNGSSEQLFALVEFSSKNRPESSILRLLCYKAQNISPVRCQWIEMTRQLVSTYYRRDARSSVRIKAVNILHNLYTENKFLYAEEFIEQLILPVFDSLDTEIDFDVQATVANFVIDVAKDCTSNNFFELLGLLERIIVTKLENFAATFEEDTLQYFANVRAIVCGLLEVLCSKWNQSPASQALAIFDLLVSHLLLQYLRTDIDPSFSWPIREMIFDFILRLKTNQFRQLGFTTHTKTVVYSVYIYCLESDEDFSPPLSPTGTTPPTVNGSAKLTRLDFKQAFSALSLCLQNERLWQVLKPVLSGLPVLLQNRLLILRDRQQVIQLCLAAVTLLNESEDRLRLFIRPPEKLYPADINELLYPLLASVVTYKDCFNEALQKKLVMAIQCGLVSQNSTLCVTATINCILEMPHIFTPMVRDLIRRLSEIPAAPKFAIPALELLSTLMRLPNMFEHFDDKDYQHLFDIALPYTNAYRFTHFIVAMAYHIVFRWYIKCPVPCRPLAAKSIINALFADNTTTAFRQNKDTSLEKVHADATAACVEFLALFLHGNDAVSHDTASADFLLTTRRSRSWILGSRVVTVATSRSEPGLCASCTSFLTQLSLKLRTRRKKSGTSDATPRATTANKERTSTCHSTCSSTCGSDTRKRHKSEMHRRKTTRVQVTSKDDSCVGDLNAESEGIVDCDASLDDSVCDIRLLSTDVVAGGQFAPSHSASAATIQVEGGADGPDEEPVLDEILPVCSCWCRGWAHVKIRHAFGDLTWLLQVNGSKIASVKTGEDALSTLNMINSLLLPDCIANECGGLSMSLHQETSNCEDSERPLERPQSKQDAEIMNERERPEDDNFSFIMNLDSEVLFSTGYGRERSATIATMGRRPTIPLSSHASSRQSSMDSKVSLPHARSDAELVSPLSSTSAEHLHGSSAKKEQEFKNKPQWLEIHEGGAISRKHSPFGPSNIASDCRQNPVLDPAQVFLKLFGPIANVDTSSRCIVLPETETVERGLKLLDRMPFLETYKIGVVYVGRRQNTEAEILSNQFGSLRYHNLIEGLGDALLLKNVDPGKTFIGGLDTQGYDGRFTYFWSDPITQVVFHVATLMPTLDSDPQCINKKRHIGNDFVCIVYNDSNNDFDLGLVHGEFAYVAIVVQPADDSALLITLKAKDEISRWLALKQLVISDAQAPLVCRQMALRAEKSAKIWQSQQRKEEPFVSNAVERLRHIARLRDKLDSKPGVVPNTGTFVDYTAV